jgi:hypothetical protein
VILSPNPALSVHFIFQKSWNVLRNIPAEVIT